MAKKITFAYRLVSTRKVECGETAYLYACNVAMMARGNGEPCTAAPHIEFSAHPDKAFRFVPSKGDGPSVPKLINAFCDAAMSRVADGKTFRQAINRLSITL